MRKLLVVAGVLAMSGCVTLPTQPVYNTTVVAPTESKVICSASYTEGEVQKWNYNNAAIVIDKGTSFVVRAVVDNSLILSSPELVFSKSTQSYIGWRNGVMYSKGVGKYEGFYGVFRNAEGNNPNRALAYDCSK
jgi:hypothetical protein